MVIFGSIADEVIPKIYNFSVRILTLWYGIMEECGLGCGEGLITLMKTMRKEYPRLPMILQQEVMQQYGETMMEIFGCLMALAVWF
jgi:hypothetical protein